MSLRARSLADDVENNRVEDTDAVNRVCALGDRIDDRGILLRLFKPLSYSVTTETSRPGQFAVKLILYDY